jgi:hypothetical protein
MAATEFKMTWARFTGKETSAGQEHFNKPAPCRTGGSRREEALTKKSEIRMSLVTSAVTKAKHRIAIAAAYGFPADLTDEQILEKLLALNLARAAEEAKAAKVKKTKAQRAKAADELL